MVTPLVATWLPAASIFTRACYARSEHSQQRRPGVERQHGEGNRVDALQHGLHAFIIARSPVTVVVTRTVHALLATGVDGAGWLAFFRNLVAGA